ncbi:MAG TPA: hypothetical protein PLQ35_02260 [bacterium]|nr:hypothetical protein [bacterium]HQL61096.1 hypothetical protein [bacterium]
MAWIPACAGMTTLNRQHTDTIHHAPERFVLGTQLVLTRLFSLFHRFFGLLFARGVR